jgi:hypothetical protein
LYGAFVSARRALNSQKRRIPARKACELLAAAELQALERAGHTSPAGALTLDSLREHAGNRGDVVEILDEGEVELGLGRIVALYYR